MHGPPIPTSFEQLRHRPFSFYPAIVNADHNEWTFRRGDWTGIQVMNTKTRDEIWVPRRFLGEISLIEEPVMIVGLVKELEYREGVVLPHVRRVIEMPRAVNDSPRPGMFTIASDRVAPVEGIRVEDSTKSRAWRLLVASVAAGIIACVAIAIFIQSVVLPHKPNSSALPKKR